MKVDEIKLIYEYNYWADHRILATCAKVSPEQYTATTNFGALRSTLVHILDSEWAWRETYQKHFIPADRVETSPPDDAIPWEHTDLTEDDVPTLAALMKRWQADEEAMRAYLDGLKDEDMNGIVRYKIPGGIVRDRVLWHCLYHNVNHSTQHRSEAAALLTSFNQSPGELDFTGFLNEYFHLQKE